jgi:murein hydrolase activator
VIAALVLVAALPLAGVSPTPAGESPELVQVRAQIRALENQLRLVVQQQSDLSQQRRRLEGELELARLRVRESEVELKRVRGEESAALKAVEAAQQQLAAAGDHLRTQVTILSVLGRAGLTPLIFHAILGGSDVQHRVTVLRALVHDQENRRAEMEKLAEQRAAALADLSERRQRTEEATSTVADRRTDLDRTTARVVAQLADLERQRRARAAELADARESETRLERLWGVVTGNGGGRRSDIGLLRGGLPWPVTGWSMRNGFGTRRDPRYGTITISHGLHLAVPPGERVRTVADGTVAFARFVKGYGNVVIVDHGSTVYSLYGELSAMLVDAGQHIAMGEPVGIVGPEEQVGGNFYLEVRVGDAPQDPLGWLRPTRR